MVHQGSTKSADRPTGGSRRTSRARIVAGVLAGLVLLTSGAAWAANARFLWSLNAVDVVGLSEAGKGDPINILLVGSDDRTGLSNSEAKALHVGVKDYGRHTDTIILIHISAENQVSAVSIPRDSYVDIPAYTDADGDKHPASQNKINISYAEGGPDLTVATVEKATGLAINHYVEVNFTGFLDIVDALGGVDVCVPEAVTDKNSGLDLPAGTSTVTGKQALAFVRARYISANADFGRMERQQQFLSAIIQKMKSPEMLNLVKANSVVDAVARSLTTDKDLDPKALAPRLLGVSPSDVEFLTVPVSDGDYRVDGIGSTVLWDKAGAASLFAAIKADQPVLKTKPAGKVTVAPADISVQVLNGTDTAGLAGTASDDLAGVGFDVVLPAANADAPVTGTAVIRVDPAERKSANTIAAAIPGATIEKVEGLGSTLQVIVGPDYDGAKPVKVSAAKPATTNLNTPTAPRTAAQNICK